MHDVPEVCVFLEYECTVLHVLYYRVGRLLSW